MIMPFIGYDSFCKSGATTMPKYLQRQAAAVKGYIRNIAKFGKKKIP
jgi:hypothetical protein